MSRRKKTVKSRPIEPTIKDFDAWVENEAKRTGKTRSEVVEETFKDGFLIVTEESGGTTMLDASQLFQPQSTKSDDITECIRLRETFGPVASCIEYLKNQLLGDGIAVIIDDAKEAFQKKVKEDIESFIEDVYQDDYTYGLNVILPVLVDIALTTGVAAAEICYGKPVSFWDYAKITEEDEKQIKIGRKTIDYILFETDEPKWEDLKGITRLKIMENAHKRFKLYRDPQSWETKYWTIDETTSKAETTYQGIRLHKLMGGKPQPAVYMHPWQVFWLVLNRKKWSEWGESVIKPALSIAKLAEKIMNSIGEGIYRAGNKKYFLICGTEKRPWSAPHVRGLMKKLQEASKKNWSTIPVPQGFDVKDIGGEVFEGSRVTEYFLKTLAKSMNVPASVLGMEVDNEPYYNYRLMKLNLMNAVRHQLFKRHIWCLYGKERQKQGGKAVEPVYVPKLRFKTEELLSKVDKLKMLVSLLNVANPVRPEVKLEIERDMCKLMGWDVVLLPTQEELKEELEELQRKAEEKERKKKVLPAGQKAQGEPKPQTLERQERRLEGMGKKGKKKGIAKPLGGTRIPKEMKVQETVTEETVPKMQVEVTTKTEPVIIKTPFDEMMKDLAEKQKELLIKQKELTEEENKRKQRKLQKEIEKLELEIKKAKSSLELSETELEEIKKTHEKKREEIEKTEEERRRVIKEAEKQIKEEEKFIKGEE